MFSKINKRENDREGSLFTLLNKRTLLHFGETNFKLVSTAYWLNIIEIQCS
jgi:hypothetical protein